METNLLIPVKTGILQKESGFLRYMQEIQKIPVLSEKEEYDHGIRVAKNGDKESAKILVQSHLRLVVKMAMKFRSYGLPLQDLVSEGNIGLIQAVKKFDPEKGFRFATYAIWWIKAQIQEYVLRSWSLVKIGTTIAQRKLFFNLSKVKRKLGLNSSDSLDESDLKSAASNLNVSESEAIEMNMRLVNSDISLNTSINKDGSDEELSDFMESKEQSQEYISIEKQESERKKYLIESALSTLNERERDIVEKRQMSEEVTTIEELGKVYKISRERVRQIEFNAVSKMKKYIMKLQKDKGWVLS